MAPFSAVTAGWLTRHSSPRVSLLSAGALCTIAAATFAMYLPSLRPLIRPIYVRKGILHEALAGVDSITLGHAEGGAAA